MVKSSGSIKKWHHYICNYTNPVLNPFPTEEYRNKYTDDYEYIVLNDEEELTDFYNICQKNDPKNELNIEHAWYVETHMKKDDFFYTEYVVNFPKTDIDFLVRCFQNNNTKEPLKDSPSREHLKKVKYKDREVDVDEGLAPLVLEIWKADLKTWDSFSKNSTQYTIRFENWLDAKKFSNIVKNYSAHAKERVLDEWYYDTIVKEDDELDFSIAVKLPIEDVKMAMDAMVKYNFRLIEMGINKLEALKH